MSESTDAGSSGAPLAGRLMVGRYRLNRPIASGGMAEVWEATDETLARRVAVKLLHPHLARDDSFVRRFRAEAVAAARLAHPSIVSVYDTFSADGMEAIVMELVVGTTMRADLDEHGPMRLDAVLAIGTQVADALGAAHGSGLVHRDVKPANILLSADGRVLVADFGIAKAAEGNDLTTAGAMVGTAKYLAPEQVEGGPIDGRADLYSLGIVLYEALTGVPPFAEETDAATALARLHRYPTEPRHLRPEIPAATEAVVMKAMSRLPDDRFASAGAMRAALMGAGADPRRAPAAAVAAAAANAPMAPASPPDGTVPASAVASDPDAGSMPVATLETPPPRRSRRWMIIVVAVALAAMAGKFALQDADGPSGEQASPRLEIASATSFDPQGDNGTEHPEQVDAAFDQDSKTVWHSERYGDPEKMAGKDGVGLILSLDGTHDIGQVDVRSPEAGWSAQVYVIDGAAPSDLAGWGDPVASVQGAEAGLTRFAPLDARGNQVLVWFTRTADSGEVAVSEVSVEAP
jgi:tRNA A-37 threonylcarbamoyl transferase component Bud32